jgi:hypothetical protein
MLPTSSTFVRSEDGQVLLVVAMTAHKFAQRPSALIGVDDDALALDFDVAAMLKLQEWQDVRENERWTTVLQSHGVN